MDVNCSDTVVAETFLLKLALVLDNQETEHLPGLDFIASNAHDATFNKSYVVKIKK